MRLFHSWKLIALVSLSFLITSCSQSFYVVRHAEKQKGPDPELTEQGVARSHNLAKVLSNAGITHIYSSDYKRTIATVAPLSKAEGVEIDLYNPAKQDAFIEHLKTLDGNTVVSGHSNTIRYVINGLYEQEVLANDLDESEYGDLFVIKRSKKGKPKSFIRERF